MPLRLSVSRGLVVLVVGLRLALHTLISLPFTLLNWLLCYIYFPALKILQIPLVPVIDFPVLFAFVSLCLNVLKF